MIFCFLSSPTEKPDRHKFPKIPKSPNPKDFRRGGGADLFKKSLELLEILESLNSRFFGGADLFKTSLGFLEFLESLEFLVFRWGWPLQQILGILGIVCFSVGLTSYKSSWFSLSLCLSLSLSLSLSSTDTESCAGHRWLHELRIRDTCGITAQTQVAFFYVDSFCFWALFVQFCLFLALFV